MTGPDALPLRVPTFVAMAECSGVRDLKTRTGGEDAATFKVERHRSHRGASRINGVEGHDEKTTGR